MFGKSQNLEFQCLEKPNVTIPMFGKSKNILRSPMFGKAKIWNSKVWKKPKRRIPMFGKAKI